MLPLQMSVSKFCSFSPAPSNCARGLSFKEITMNEKQWEQFFDLIERIVTPKTKVIPSWEERKAEVLEKVSQYGASSNFSEFINWFDGQID